MTIAVISGVLQHIPEYDSDACWMCAWDGDGDEAVQPLAQPPCCCCSPVGGHARKRGHLMPVYVSARGDGLVSLRSPQVGVLLTGLLLKVFLVHPRTQGHVIYSTFLSLKKTSPFIELLGRFEACLDILQSAPKYSGHNME